MASEQLPELNKGEPAHWAGEQDPGTGSDDEKVVGPDAQQGLAQLSRSELELLAAQLAISSEFKPTSEEGSDTYLG